MTSSRQIADRISWQYLVLEGFFWYVLTFVAFFVKLHFVGTRIWVPSLHREYLSVDDSLVQATAWAFIGPSLWLLHDYVLQGSKMWRSFCDLDWGMQRMVVAGLVGVVMVTVLAWKIMCLLWGLVATVGFYMRFSRPKNSL
jgi:hypothetical protein